MKEKQSNSQDNYTVPTFVEKLYTILQNSSNHSLICWSDDGKSFGVKDLSQFCSKVLPNYFKHGNWQSFVRQLNMYGFTKLSDAFHLSSTTCSWDFKHPDFQRDTPELFVKIRRKAYRPPSKEEKNKDSTPIGEDLSQSYMPETRPSTGTSEQLTRKIEDLERMVFSQNETIIKLQQQFEQNVKFQKNAVKLISSFQYMLQDTLNDYDDRASRRRKLANELLYDTQDLINNTASFEPIYSHSRNPPEYRIRHGVTRSRENSYSAPSLRPELTNLNSTQPIDQGFPYYPTKRDYHGKYTSNSHSFDSSKSFLTSTQSPENTSCHAPTVHLSNCCGTSRQAVGSKDPKTPPQMVSNTIQNGSSKHYLPPINDYLTYSKHDSVVYESQHEHHSYLHNP